MAEPRGVDVRHRPEQESEAVGFDLTVVSLGPDGKGGPHGNEGNGNVGAPEFCTSRLQPDDQMATKTLGVLPM